MRKWQRWQIEGEENLISGDKRDRDRSCRQRGRAQWSHTQPFWYGDGLRKLWEQESTYTRHGCHVTGRGMNDPKVTLGGVLRAAWIGPLPEPFPPLYSSPSLRPLGQNWLQLTGRSSWLFGWGFRNSPAPSFCVSYRQGPPVRSFVNRPNVIPEGRGSLPLRAVQHWVVVFWKSLLFLKSPVVRVFISAYSGCAPWNVDMPAMVEVRDQLSEARSFLRPQLLGIELRSPDLHNGYLWAILPTMDLLFSKYKHTLKK